MRKEDVTPVLFRRRYGQLSGMVEPVAGLLGAAAVSLAEPILPYALSFAAGAMIYVVFDDILPEAQTRYVLCSHLYMYIMYPLYSHVCILYSHTGVLAACGLFSRFLFKTTTDFV